MKNKKWIYYLGLFIFGMGAIQACKSYHFRSNYKDVNSLMHESKNLQTKLFLKAHLKNGDICILQDSWTIDTLSNSVLGNGTQYDFNREISFKGPLSIPIDSVAIFETNKKLNDSEKSRIGALSILAGVDVILGVICLSSPKACFGSCPTFYINEEDDFHYSDAEGFSNAISPSLEYSDIDALQEVDLNDSVFSITMKNEALETHCINDVLLLAYPKLDNQRIYQSPSNDFYLCENNYLLTKAEGKEGDITHLIDKDDRMERFSLSDPNNLSSKEELYLEFDAIQESEQLGLILNFRQTMMTTYLIYSAMGYMGNEVGDIFARIENDKNTKEKLGNKIEKELGNIDIYVWNDRLSIWDYQSGFNETGPIAINRQFIPLKYNGASSKVKVKIILNSGLWRIDYAALTNIKEKVEPIAISPSTILNKGKLDTKALKSLTAEDEYLISMPGSAFKFEFHLPKADTDYELFLYSKGYYLEWMREHWLKDKDLFKLKELIDNPEKFLKREAELYKEYETTMESEFWNSKIDTKTFSFHEN